MIRPALHPLGLGLATAALVMGLAGCGRSPAPIAPTPSTPAAPAKAPATNAAAGFQAVTFNKSNQKSALLVSEDVTPLPDGRPVLIKPRLTTFRDDGSIAWIADPAECVYDDKDHVAASPKLFHAYSADRRFEIRGLGFQLRLEEAHLFISNAVETVIRKPPPTNAPAAAEAPLEVRSHEFDYETNRAVYRGQVRAEDPEGKLQCELLTAQFARSGSTSAATNETRIETITAETNVVLEQKDIQATGEQAFYRAAENTIEITGHPAWRAGADVGRGDRLWVNRTTREMRAAGHVSMKLARVGTNAPALLFAAAPASGGAGATNPPIEINADDLDYRPGSAIFSGHVRAVDRTGQLTCARMTVTFEEPGNRIQSILAEREVVILNLEDRTRATGERAFFTADNHRVKLTGQPRWSTPELEGQAEILEFDTQTRGLAADRAVAVRLISRGTNSPAAFLTMLSFSTNAPVAAKGPTWVYSDHLEFNSEVAVFRGRVRVQDPSGTLRCGILTATFAKPANRIQTVVAERQVDLEQAETQLTCGRLTVNAGDLLAEQGVEIITQIHTRPGTNTPVNVIGSRAFYQETNGQLRVTGQPVLMTPQLTSTGQVLVWNRADRSLRMQGLSRTYVNREALEVKRPGMTNASPTRH